MTVIANSRAAVECTLELSHPKHRRDTGKGACGCHDQAAVPAEIVCWQEDGRDEETQAANDSKGCAVVGSRGS